jgi:hypothetical protein
VSTPAGNTPIRVAIFALMVGSFTSVLVGVIIYTRFSDVGDSLLAGLGGFLGLFLLTYILVSRDTRRGKQS